jgi:transcriptional regulator with XRE-family HTH domain
MNGQRNPSVTVLRKMASFFDMSMDAIDSKLEEIRNAPAEWI